MSKEFTLNEIDEAIQKTEGLLRRLKNQRRNPGMPLHLAPKGKKPKSRTKSKPKSRTKSKPRLRTRSRTRSKPKSDSNKAKLEMMGIEPKLLFGLDESELGALLDNPQLRERFLVNDFRPPDDSPRQTPPLGFYDYPVGDNPNDPATLHRNTALTQMHPAPVQHMQPRFG